jgi:hypothetical protein
MRDATLARAKGKIRNDKPIGSKGKKKHGEGISFLKKKISKFSVPIAKKEVGGNGAIKKKSADPYLDTLGMSRKYTCRKRILLKVSRRSLPLNGVVAY